MSGRDGDLYEMPIPHLDDRALEALLSRAHAQSGFDWLVPFVEDLEKASQEPAPVVRPVLALLLKEGFSPASGTDHLATSPAPAAMPPAPSTERAVVRPVLRGALGRFAGLGLLAKAGLGFGLVAASTTAAGAAGVLPGPAQDAVAKVVNAATPFSFPDKASDKADHGRNVSSDATGASDGVAGVDGKAVSDAAKTPRPTETPGNGSTPAGTPSNGTAVGPSDTGATGLDRANETPAAGNVPTSVPGRGGPPATPGKPTGGPEAPNTPPAATNAPTSIPAATPAGPPATASPGGTGRGTVTTPAAGGNARP